MKTLKTKLYSKKQIQEAIAFWTKILENTSPLIDSLVEEFGYDVVFGKQKIIPTMKMIEKIYSLINMHVFDNKLNACPIENDTLGFCKTGGAAMIYYSILYPDSETNPTKYILLTQLGQDPSGKVHYPPRIYVSDELLNTSISIVTLASIVAHEMIHQYIIEIGNGVKRQFDKDYRHDSYDPHKNDEFTSLMNDINAKFGLNVKYVGNGKYLYDHDSVKALKKFAGNDYNISENEEQNDMKKVLRYANGYVGLLLM